MADGKTPRAARRGGGMNLVGDYLLSMLLSFFVLVVAFPANMGAPRGPADQNQGRGTGAWRPKTGTGIFGLRHGLGTGKVAWRLAVAGGWRMKAASGGQNGGIREIVCFSPSSGELRVSRQTRGHMRLFWPQGPCGGRRLFAENSLATTGNTNCRYEKQSFCQ